jgi:hypothetical protein
MASYRRGWGMPLLLRLGMCSAFCGRAWFERTPQATTRGMTEVWSKAVRHFVHAFISRLSALPEQRVRVCSLSLALFSSAAASSPGP